LMTNFISADFIRQKFWRARLLPCRNFRSGRSPTLQENSPTKVFAQFLRHQLRTEVRSMICFRLHHQLWTEVRSMFCIDGSLWRKATNRTFRTLSWHESAFGGFAWSEGEATLSNRRRQG